MRRPTKEASKVEEKRRQVRYLLIKNTIPGILLIGYNMLYSLNIEAFNGLFDIGFG